MKFHYWRISDENHDIIYTLCILCKRAHSLSLMYRLVTFTVLCLCLLTPVRLLLQKNAYRKLIKQEKTNNFFRELTMRRNAV